MNCFPDGTPLGTKDFVEIALAYKLVTKADLPGLLATHQKRFGDHMKRITDEVRFDMMCAGKLIIRTKIRNPVSVAKPKVDQEMVDFLLSRKVA